MKRPKAFHCRLDEGPYRELRKKVKGALRPRGVRQLSHYTVVMAIAEIRCAQAHELEERTPDQVVRHLLACDGCFEGFGRLVYDIAAGIW